MLSMKLHLQEELDMEEVRRNTFSLQPSVLNGSNLTCSSPADVRAVNPAEQAAAGRDLRHRPQSPGNTSGDAAGLVVPPQLQRGADQQVMQQE